MPTLQVDAPSEVFSFEKEPGERLGIFLRLSPKDLTTVLVNNCDPESPAYLDLSPGDVLEQVNDDWVRSPEHGSQLILDAGGAAGCRLRVTFASDTSPKSVLSPLMADAKSKQADARPRKGWLGTIKSTSSRYNRLD